MVKVRRTNRFREHLRKTHRKYRPHTEVITYEEVTWLLIGIGFGWIASEVSYPLLLLIPIFLFIFWAIAKRHERKFGLKNVFGEPFKTPR